MPGIRRHDTALAVLACLYAAAVIPLAIHKGGDFTSELGQSERLLRGLPPFGAADPNIGVPWPPFSAAALIPFALLARVSLPLAKGVWAAGSVACLWWCVRWAAQKGWRPALLALVAVAVPLQTNFEHLNIAAVLLALVVLAIADLEAGRNTRAGVAIGVATALKAFPGLLLVYFAVQRPPPPRWRALAAGAGVALSLTLLALLPLGATGAITGVRDWLLLGLGHHWVAQPAADQSLGALVTRLGGSTSIGLVIGAVLVVVTLAFARWRPDALLGMGAWAVLAVLLSPIAWVHSFVLLFPAWLGVLTSAGEGGALGPARRVTLIVAGIGTSGLLTVGPRPLRSLLLLHGVYTWSAILLWIVVLFCSRARPIPTAPVSA